MVTWFVWRFYLVPTSTSLAWSLIVISSSKPICLVLFPVFLREFVVWGWWNIYLWKPLLFRCYFAFVLPILEYCCPVWGSAAEYHLQLLARLCPDLSFLLCYRRHVAGLSMLYEVNWNSNDYLFRELPSAPTRVRHRRAAAAAHTLEFEVLKV